VHEGTPCFRGKEISELKKGKNPSNILYIKESKFNEFKDKFGAPKQGDILITSVGTLGNVYKVNIQYNFYFKDGNLIWLKNPTVNSDFLEMSIDFNKRNLLKGVIGSTQKALTIDGIKKVNLLFPSLSEQQKIAGFLDDVDKWIENLKTQKKKLEEHKLGMMQKIFSQEVRFKHNNGKDFPEWELERLGNICEKKSSSISSNTLEKNTGEFSIYGAAGFLKKVDFYQEETPFISIVKDGASVGRILLCEEKSSVLGTLDILKPKEKTNLYFLYLLLSRLSFLKYITGLAIPHIYFKDYSKENVRVPSLLEQQKIAEFFISIDKLIESKEQQIKKVEMWKKGLMQKMFV
jgi:type I restriction enzyme S subunit